MHYYHKDGYFSFQLKNKEWMKGIITKVENDSFYFTKEVIIFHFGGGTDTMHFSGFHYALSDVYALPKRGVQIDWMGDRFNITKSGGHQHFYWVKSGYIFRMGALTYTGVNIVNSIIKNDWTLFFK